MLVYQQYLSWQNRGMGNSCQSCCYQQQNINQSKICQNVPSSKEPALSNPQSYNMSSNRTTFSTEQQGSPNKIRPPQPSLQYNNISESSKHILQSIHSVASNQDENIGEVIQIPQQKQKQKQKLKQVPSSSLRLERKRQVRSDPTYNNKEKQEKRLLKSACQKIKE